MTDEFDFDYEAPTANAEPAKPTQPAPVQTAQQPVVSQQTQQDVSEMGVFEIPDLRKGKLSIIPVGSRYWTPESEGEFKYGIVRRFENQIYEKVDERTGEITQETLRTLIFAEQREDLSWVVFSNCSKKLVGDLEGSVKSGEIIPNKTGVFIKYLGKVKNATNSFKHDDFEIRTID
ncbi:MAG: hypothetical protein WCL34_08505 [Methylococcaceae bacterium]